MNGVPHGRSNDSARRTASPATFEAGPGYLVAAALVVTEERANRYFHV
jgi:hypothetical protein